MKKLTYAFTPWQVLVIRAALENHAKATDAPKHLAELKPIKDELRKHDRPPT